ncbi:beta-ketoacyl synthase chain length factor [Achromobacter seleniivolatilans]|uniref:Beta-ketoacyl synthase chain length factor n=1 Tax=Achromobacter seleniivolatilans TaxID=3047478 RepID=A0ABY9M7C8_9BURK|nr:beta-ketoacyl synthase chain length factor [Achromobacter sp. R39]WMD22880.1 beta-ketoacyl synthase chain length factor [Achromobacter sp. R39]
MLTFSIAQWQGWTQGIDEPTDWLDWAKHPYCPLGDQRAPRLDFLPPMQRRRLSPLARAVFECAWPLGENHPNMPLVFASRHGETTRNFGLLQSLAAGEALSPTAFGLSVHNAIAAQWSIIRRETAESVALSVEDDGLEHAFIEAAMLFDQGHKDVLLVLAEERPPAAYTPWMDDVPYTYAAAFRLRPGNEWTLTMSAEPAHTDASREQVWPNPLNLLRHLTLRTPSWHHANHARRWTWTRTE